MNITDYKDPDKGGDYQLKFFANNPVSKWSFELFSELINEGRRFHIKKNALLSSYLVKLNMIFSDKETPQDVKNYIRELKKKV